MCLLLQILELSEALAESAANRKSSFGYAQAVVEEPAKAVAKSRKAAGQDLANGDAVFECLDCQTRCVSLKDLKRHKVQNPKLVWNQSIDVKEKRINETLAQ